MAYLGVFIALAAAIWYGFEEDKKKKKQLD